MKHLETPFCKDIKGLNPKLLKIIVPYRKWFYKENGWSKVELTDVPLEELCDIYEWDYHRIVSGENIEDWEEMLLYHLNDCLNCIDSLRGP